MLSSDNLGPHEYVPKGQGALWGRLLELYRYRVYNVYEHVYIYIYIYIYIRVQINVCLLVIGCGRGLVIPSRHTSLS